MSSTGCCPGRPTSSRPPRWARTASEHFACGDDPDEHLRHLTEYFDAGFDEVYVSQIGPQQKGFFDFYCREILPQLAAPSE